MRGFGDLLGICCSGDFLRSLPGSGDVLRDEVAGASRAERGGHRTRSRLRSSEGRYDDDVGGGDDLRLEGT